MSAAGGSAGRRATGSPHQRHKSRSRARLRLHAGSARALLARSCALGATADLCAHARRSARRNPECGPDRSSAFGDAVDDAFAARDVSRFAEVILHVRLRANPIEIPADAFAEIDLRLVTGGSDTLCSAGEVTHFAR